MTLRHWIAAATPTRERAYACAGVLVIQRETRGEPHPCRFELLFSPTNGDVPGTPDVALEWSAEQAVYLIARTCPYALATAGVVYKP